MKPELTDKQKMFVKEYLVDLNATQAAIRSGYSKDTATQIGSENLSKPYIREAIDEEIRYREIHAEVSVEYVLRNLKKIVDRCVNEETFDSAGANRSLELLGKHLRLFTDRVEKEITFANSPVKELINSIENIKNEDNKEI